MTRNMPVCWYRASNPPSMLVKAYLHWAFVVHYFYSSGGRRICLKTWLYWAFLVRDSWLWLENSDYLLVELFSRRIGNRNFPVTIISCALKRLNVNGPSDMRLPLMSKNIFNHVRMLYIVMLIKCNFYYWIIMDFFYPSFFIRSPSK